MSAILPNLSVTGPKSGLKLYNGNTTHYTLINKHSSLYIHPHVISNLQKTKNVFSFFYNQTTHPLHECKTTATFLEISYFVSYRFEQNDGEEIMTEFPLNNPLKMLSL